LAPDPSLITLDTCPNQGNQDQSLLGRWCFAGCRVDITVEVALNGRCDRGDDGVVVQAGQRLDLPDKAHEGQARQLGGDEAAAQCSERRSSSGRTADARQLWSGGAATAVIAALIALVGILVCRWLFNIYVWRRARAAHEATHPLRRMRSRPPPRWSRRRSCTCS
jgi:hypothetical protein